MYDVLAGTYLVRCFVRSHDDLVRVFKITVVLIIPVSLAMAYERLYCYNFFSCMGGVPALSTLREGKIRAQGPFLHSILAGTIGASCIPISVCLWYLRNRTIAIAGIIAGTGMAYVANSSGAMLSFAFGIISLVLWPMRFRMRTVRYLMLAGIVLTDLSMKAPIWWIFDKVSGIMGGTGYHRSMLIDAAVLHFKEWWLIGTTYTTHWMPYHPPSTPTMVDFTNHFLWEGVNGGLVTMILFLVIIVRAFRENGKALRLAAGVGRERELTVWALGCCMVVHLAASFSVAYFDQTLSLWAMTLAFAGAMVDYYVGCTVVNETDPCAQGEVSDVRVEFAR